jgi:hypothetical protein
MMNNPEVTETFKSEMNCDKEACIKKGYCCEQKNNISKMPSFTQCDPFKRKYNKLFKHQGEYNDEFGSGLLIDYLP